MGPQQLPSLCLPWPLEWTKAPLSSMSCTSQGEGGEVTESPHGQGTNAPAHQKIRGLQKEFAMAVRAIPLGGVNRYG
jgi:hypothetical protein